MINAQKEVVAVDLVNQRFIVLHPALELDGIVIHDLMESIGFAEADRRTTALIEWLNRGPAALEWKWTPEDSKLNYGTARACDFYLEVVRFVQEKCRYFSKTETPLECEVILHPGLADCANLKVDLRFETGSSGIWYVGIDRTNGFARHYLRSRSRLRQKHQNRVALVSPDQKILSKEVL